MTYKLHLGKSLTVQRLRHRAFIAEGLGLIPGLGTKILQAKGNGKKIKQMNRKYFQTALMEIRGRPYPLPLCVHTHTCSSG